MKSYSNKYGVVLIAISFIFLFSLATYADDLDKPYSPTRKEWLEISMFKLIKIRTDSWQQRIGFLVWVVEKENTVFITLTSASRQMPLEKEQEKYFVEIVKSDIEYFLKKYEWSKNLKVHIQFI